VASKTALLKSIEVARLEGSARGPGPAPASVEAAGELLATTGGHDAIDATVIASAAQRGDPVFTEEGVDVIRV
jgi:hypothetical protein